MPNCSDRLIHSLCIDFKLVLLYFTSLIGHYIHSNFRVCGVGSLPSWLHPQDLLLFFSSSE